MAVSGVGLGHLLDNTVISSSFRGRMVVTSGVLITAGIDNPGVTDEQGVYTIDRGSERVDVAPWPFPSEEAGEEPEFRFDLHVWTSPKDVHIQAANLGASLAATVPEAASSISTATVSYLEDTDALDRWVTGAIETVLAGQHMLFTSYDAFSYFSRDYGIHFIGVALSDFSEQRDATADHIAKAVAAVKESSAVALFTKSSSNSESIEAIARAAGVTPIVGEDAMYGDSLNPDGSEGATYVGSIVHDIRVVTQVWGNTVSDPPKCLKDQ